MHLEFRKWLEKQAYRCYFTGPVYTKTRWDWCISNNIKTSDMSLSIWDWKTILLWSQPNK